MYDDPDEADDLQQCIQNAKDEYQARVVVAPPGLPAAKQH